MLQEAELQQLARTLFLSKSIEENAATQKSREKECLHLVNFGIVAGEDAESC
jgi:hypothetical protein